jgi:hypothetical protein
MRMPEDTSSDRTRERTDVGVAAKRKIGLGDSFLAGIPEFNGRWGCLVLLPGL